MPASINGIPKGFEVGEISARALVIEEMEEDRTPIKG